MYTHQIDLAVRHVSGALIEGVYTVEDRRGEGIASRGVAELARRFEDDGVSAIVYTDISRDGMMQGVNVEATQHLAESVSIPVIASGGVTNLDDIKKLNAVKSSGIEGVIIGQALYTGAVSLPAAIRAATD